ncbi:hypothetical protein K1719_018736 [Acacia pycnantha]|nr:hypothetical protein K1719_018736 [Acacia pycnantha]
MEIDSVLTPIDDNEQPDPETSPGKRRRKKSMVWEHFTVETVGAGCARAYCKQCKKSFAYINGSKVAGTSHLKRHIALGICPVSRQNNQLNLYSKTGGSGDIADPPRKRTRATTTGFAGMSFDHGQSNHDITKMIILHDYPLHIVEHQGFIDFVHSLQPQFNVPSLNSVQEDCVESHEEKFLELKQQLQVPSMKDLVIDDKTKWDTTYHMLVAACELKEVFACFDTFDADFRMILSMGEWKQIETLCTYLKIFGENSEPWIRIVEDGLRELFLEYIVQVLPFTSSNGDEGNEVMISIDSCQDQSFDESLLDVENGLSDFDIYISDFTCNQQMKTELEQYLEDPLLPSPDEFDILSWWRLNRLKYPTLSKMASDILSIPVSTLSADSVFDTKQRNMNCYRSSLGSKTLEALICAKDWFQYESLPIDVSNVLVKSP